MNDLEREFENVSSAVDTTCQDMLNMHYIEQLVSTKRIYTNIQKILKRPSLVYSLISWAFNPHGFTIRVFKVMQHNSRYLITPY